MSATPSAMTFVVVLSNEGIGPAIIRSVSIEPPAELGGGRFDEWGPVVAALRARGVTVLSYWNFAEGEALAVQRQQELLRASVASSDSSATVLEQLARLHVRVTYASIYGDLREAGLN